MNEDIIEAVARAYAKVADGANFDAMTPAGREMYAKRVMPIIAAYEAARGDVVVPSFQDGLEAAAQYLEMCDDYGDRLKAHEIRALAASQGER